MKKIWMVMLFGIMLLMAKSNNVYAETYETDLSQYNVGDNILQTTFEINTDEECEYEIVESGTFHNGHAVVMMKEVMRKQMKSLEMRSYFWDILMTSWNSDVI